MPWNYRVFVEHHPSGEDVYTIRSSFYDAGEAVPHSWSVEPVAPQGATRDDLGADLSLMVAALKLPALTETTDGRCVEVPHPGLPDVVGGDGGVNRQGVDRGNR